MRIYLFVSFILFASCSQKLEKCQTENGFGKLELGMTRKKFDANFPGLKVTNDKVGIFHFDSLSVSNHIKLKEVELWFFDQELVEITVNYDPELFNLLKQQNGIIEKDSMGTKKYVEFKTKSKDIVCMYLKSDNDKPKIGFCNIKKMRID